jgi:hypothetical protein
MAKYTGMHRDDLPTEAERQRFDKAVDYLVNLVTSGETDWRPTKSIKDYTAEQVFRKESSFRRQEEAGLKPWNATTRGHSSKDGKHAPKPPTGTTPEQYKAIPKQSQRTKQQASPQKKEKSSLEKTSDKIKRFRHTTVSFGGNNFHINTDTPARFQKIIERIANINPALIVYPGWKDKDGYWHSKFQKGIKIKTLLRLIEEKKAEMKQNKQRGNPLAALIEQWEAEGDTSPIYDEETDNGIPEFTLLVMEKYLQAA